MFIQHSTKFYFAHQQGDLIKFKIGKICMDKKCSTKYYYAHQQGNLIKINMHCFKNFSLTYFTRLLGLSRAFYRILFYTSSSLILTKYIYVVLFHTYSRVSNYKNVFIKHSTKYYFKQQKGSLIKFNWKICMDLRNFCWLILHVYELQIIKNMFIQQRILFFTLPRKPKINKFSLIHFTRILGFQIKKCVHKTLHQILFEILAKRLNQVKD